MTSSVADMSWWDERDARPGDAWSLGQFYALVPDAYELDLLEDARVDGADSFETESTSIRRMIDDLRGDVDVENIEIAGGPPLDPPTDDTPEPPPPFSLTQAQFVVERMLGGEVVDDRRD